MPDVGRRRGDVDDAPPTTVDHARQAALDGAVRSVEVGRDHVAPGRVVVPGERHLGRDAGGVDQDVDRAERADRIAEERLDRIVGPHVERAREGADAVALDFADTAASSSLLEWCV